MATTMTATLFYLLHYPSTLHLLRDEIDSKFHSADDIVMGPRLSSCIYLRACIDETLRLNPPVGGVLPRGGSPSESLWASPNSLFRELFLFHLAKLSCS